MTKFFTWQIYYFYIKSIVVREIIVNKINAFKYICVKFKNHATHYRPLYKLRYYRH